MFFYIDGSFVFKIFYDAGSDPCSNKFFSNVNQMTFNLAIYFMRFFVLKHIYLARIISFYAFPEVLILRLNEFFART